MGLGQRVRLVEVVHGLITVHTHMGLGQGARILLVEVLHGVDARVVGDLLNPPHSPDVSLKH